MSNPHQLERDFGIPARFYKTLGLHQKGNPVFLSRLLRPRPREKRNIPKNLCVEVTGLVAKEPGLLLVSLILIPSYNIVDLKEIPVGKGKVDNQRFSFLEAKVAHGTGLVLVITFYPTPLGVSVPEAKDIGIKNVLEDLLQGKNAERNDLYICGLDIAAKHAELKVRDKKCPSTQKQWMTPVCSNRQEIILKTQPRDILAQRELTAKVLINWVYKSPSKMGSLRSPVENISSSNGASSSSAVAVPGLRQSSSKKLIYHYIYTDPDSRLVKEKREVKHTIECVICGSHFGSYCEDTDSKERQKAGFSCHPLNKSTRKSVKLLLIHLKNCHFHFEYHTMKDEDGNLLIFMRRDRKHDLDYNSLLLERRQQSFWINRFSSLRESFSFQDLPMVKLPSIALRNGDAKASDAVVDDNELVMARQYYHPRTGLPMVTEELGYESDEECTTWWELMEANKALDEYLDIGYEEKTFMKLWNAHMISFPSYGDSYLSVSVERFVRRFAVEIVDQHLRYHFLFHLITMWDFGLLRGDEIQFFLAIVDQQVKEKKEIASETIVEEQPPISTKNVKKSSKLKKSLKY